MNDKLLQYKKQLPDNIELLEDQYNGRKNMLHKCTICDHVFKITANKMKKLNRCPLHDQHTVEQQQIIEAAKQINEQPIILDKKIKFDIDDNLTVAKFIKRLPPRKKLFQSVTDVDKPVKIKCTWCKIIFKHSCQHLYDVKYRCPNCGRI